jgi:hypothetical protein
MALTQVTGPYPIFTDLDGSPLDDGYLYIGAINDDPETNPIQVFWDSALTIPATQPIRTSNGYAYRNGTPALLYTAGAFSITIRNKRNEFVLYSPVGYGFDPAAVSASVVKNDFIGDGVTVAFVLSASPSTILATNIFINGVYQEKDSYTLSGNTITFTVAPPLSSSIEILTNETGIINSGNANDISYTLTAAGATLQSVQTKLEQYVSVKDFGAVGDGVTDDTAAIQSAIDYAAPLGKAVYFPSGVYRTTQTVGFTRSDAQQFGLHIVGENNIYTEIKADHSSGAVLALNRSFGSVSDIALTASTSRNTGAAGANYGLLMEAPDVAGQAVAAMSIRRVRVLGQPSHGIVHVGLSIQSYYEQNLCQANLGHGYVFDGGQLTSRVNTAYPGLVNLVSCWSTSNAGHALKIGDPADDASFVPVRFTMFNCEFSDNALAAGVRLTADEIWIRGTNIVFDTCAVGSVATSSIGNIRFAGENLEVRNHRSINATHTLRVEKDHNLATTYGINIGELRVVAQVQNPVVIITDLINVKDLTANTYGGTSNMTSMFTPGAIRAVWNRFPPISIVRKTTTQTVNNSTTLVDDNQLELELANNETVYFEAVIRYNGDATADIKIAFVAPAGSTIRWDNYNSMYVSAADTILISTTEVTEGNTRSFGCAVGVRTLNIRGYCQVGSTSGALKMQFAQNAAVVADTNIQFNSVLKVFRENANI